MTELYSYSENKVCNNW